MIVTIGARRLVSRKPAASSATTSPIRRVRDNN
jgi:hypothetical protein